ncbi:MAG: GTP cyclohydrolase I FolE2 [Oligoflexales bacterium]|nr:GTP cyclohydrolase I FolE2 [Oligoflexales bacterium]
MIDIQSTEIKSKFEIDSTGILNLVYPITVLDNRGDSQEVQRQSAKWKLGVSLSKEQRGTHMSRFIEVLNKMCDGPVSLDDFFKLCNEVRTYLGSRNVNVEAEFTWLRKVAAPVSRLEGYVNCQVGFSGRIKGEVEEKVLSVEIPATALCPCSKAISARGAHNQRAFIKADIFLNPKSVSPSINKIIQILENSASSAIYPILKREDEKYVTELAYDNPSFVEDLARKVATELFDLPAFEKFKVRVINQESIHNHDCYAEVVYSRS